VSCCESRAGLLTAWCQESFYSPLRRRDAAITRSKRNIHRGDAEGAEENKRPSQNRRTLRWRRTRRGRLTPHVRRRRNLPCRQSTGPSPLLTRVTRNGRVNLVFSASIRSSPRRGVMGSDLRVPWASGRDNRRGVQTAGAGGPLREHSPPRPLPPQRSPVLTWSLSSSASQRLRGETFFRGDRVLSPPVPAPAAHCESTALPGLCRLSAQRLRGEHSLAAIRPSRPHGTPQAPI
jgi:hypothetical protein